MTELHSARTIFHNRRGYLRTEKSIKSLGGSGLLRQLTLAERVLLLPVSNFWADFLQLRAPNLLLN